MFFKKQKPAHLEIENIMLKSINSITPGLTIDKTTRLDLNISNKCKTARAKIESINRIRNTHKEKQLMKLKLCIKQHIKKYNRFRKGDRSETGVKTSILIP